MTFSASDSIAGQCQLWGPGGTLISTTELHKAPSGGRRVTGRLAPPSQGYETAPSCRHHVPS